VFVNGHRISGKAKSTGTGTAGLYDDDDIGFKVTNGNYPSSGTEYYLGAGDISGGSAVANFAGVIDEARWLTYEKQAFAGGLMISKVVPSTNTITVYNSGDFSMDLTGVKIWNGVSSCSFSGTLASEGTDTCSLSVGTTDGLRMDDENGGNDAGINSPDENEKEWMIDGVCWNNDGTTIDGTCDGSDDPLIMAGIWTQNTAVNMDNNDITLISNGNNDEAVSDWESIPEFGTLLMPIASVLMIVGYNYRRREQLES